MQTESDNCYGRRLDSMHNSNLALLLYPLSELGGQVSLKSSCLEAPKTIGRDCWKMIYNNPSHSRVGAERICGSRTACARRPHPFREPSSRHAPVPSCPITAIPDTSDSNPCWSPIVSFAREGSNISQALKFFAFFRLL